MPRATVVAAFVSALALVAAAPAAAQPIDSREQLPHLFADEGTLPGLAGPVTSEGDMLDGFAYIVRVRGTYSAYDRRLMLLQGPFAVGWHLCGERERARGQDAEFIWGFPQADGSFCPELPIAHENLLIDSGFGFEHITPFDPPDEPDGIERGNTYRYLVFAENGDGPVSVALADSNLSDNVGGFSVSVRPLRERDCQDGGWEDFDDEFVSDEDCLDFVP